MRVKITLACTECKQRNYNMTKEKKNHPDRMETSKYCRFCRKHTLHKETKSDAGKESGEMSEAAEKAPKKSWFKGLKAEYKKIIWPDKKSLTKQTAAVVVTSIVLGIIIKVLDVIMTYGVDALIKL